MADYISKQVVIDYLKGYLHSLGYDNSDLHVNGQRLALINAINDISAAKAADVQPVDRWINVNEALPIYDGLVLICYNDKTIRLAIYTVDGWYSDEGEPIMEQPDYWVRIPEPPMLE